MTKKMKKTMKIELNLAELKDIETKLQKFVDKVDNHKARSSETYADIKEVLAFLKRKKDRALADLLKNKLEK